MKLALKYWFEWSAPSPFWPGNEAAYTKFDGGCISLDRLPLSSEIKHRLRELCAWHDTCLNWESPTDPGPWRQNEHNRFSTEAKALFEVAQEQLGDEYELINHSFPSMEDPQLDDYLQERSDWDYEVARRLMQHFGHDKLGVKRMQLTPALSALHQRFRAAMRGDGTKSARWASVDARWLADHGLVAALKQRNRAGYAAKAEDFVHLAKAFENQNVFDVYGTHLIREEAYTHLYAIETSLEGLMQGYPECASSLFSQDLSAVIVKTFDNFWGLYDLYVGSKEFVEDCLGMTMLEAYKQLEKEAATGMLPDKIVEDLNYYRGIWPL